MSTLNLTPNPAALITQALIFASNLVIVKKLMLDPFLKQKRESMAATAGSQSDAKGLIEKTEQASSALTQKIQNAHQDIRRVVDDIKTRTTKRRQEIIGQAEKESKAFVHQMQDEINKGLSEERTKLASSARVLAGQLLDRVLA